MTTWKKVVLGIVVFLTLLTVFVAFILPGIVRDRAIQEVEKATGRKLSVGSVSINPFTWTAEVDRVRLTEKGKDATFVSFSSARLSVSPASIFRAAPVVSELRLVSPYVHLVRTAANTYNFSDLLQEKKNGKAERKEAEKKPRFSLNNITIVNGAVDFHDLALRNEKVHTVRRLDLSVPFISTLPYMADRYVTPSLSAVINGAPFKAGGKLKIYPHLAEASVTVKLSDLDLPFYQSYLPVNLPVSVARGKLTTAVDITYRVAKKEKPELFLAGSLQLADALLRDRTGEPLVSLARGDVRVRQVKAMAGEFALSSIATNGLEIYLSRDRRGVWSPQRLTSRKQSPPSERKTQLTIDQVRMKGGKFHFTDLQPARGFRTDLDEMSLDMDGFSTLPEKKARYKFSAESSKKEKLNITGEFSVSPFNVTSSLDLNSLALEAYRPYLDAFLREPVKGQLDLKTDLTFSPKASLQLDKLEAQLRQFSASFRKGEGIRLKSAALKGGKLSLAERNLSLETINLSDGSLRFSRDAKGVFSFRNLLQPKQAAHSPRVEKTTTAARPFRYLIKSIGGNRLNVSFADGMKEDRPVFNLRGIRFTVARFSGPDRPSRFSFAAGYGKGATLKGTGVVRGEPLLVQGDFTVRRLPLTDFEPYLPENLAVTLADGTVDSRMNLRLAMNKGVLAGQFRGELGVRRFYCLDAEGDDLLKWESLQIDKIRGGIGPFSLSIDEIALNNFYSKILVNKDGTLNLQHLMVEEEGEETAAPKAEASTTATPSTPAKVTPASGHGPIKIGAITMQDGVLAFTDQHLKNQYATTFYNLGGRISGLSSEENRFADVDLRGNLENLSPLRITGQINPLRDDLFVNLKVSFNDIEVSPLTPYSSTYLGYTIDKGKLFLDLKYRIEKKKLFSENKVFIDQFTFGSKVESDKATNLPVRLGVALLKDRKGEIHLDLPVTGQTDDPQFSVWRVVLKILKNLFVKAATSPFALLSSAFGDKEDFNSVTFSYGSADISPVEREKLLKLASALRDRPSIKVEVTGYVSKEQDAEGYRNELLEKKLRTEKFLELTRAKKNQPGDSPDSMKISTTEYPRYLMAVYKKEKFPKPRTFIGTIKDIPDAEKKKLILAHTQVTEENLRALGRERAAAVANFLVTEGKLESTRVFQKSGDIYKPPAKEGVKASRVEFGATVD